MGEKEGGVGAVPELQCKYRKDWTSRGNAERVEQNREGNLRFKVRHLRSRGGAPNHK